jgi:DNA-binding NtrC family response regulator
MSTLLVIRGPNLGVRHDLGDLTRIGRGVENEIQVRDPGISRVHAEIVRARKAFTIHDRDSKNGVLVNGVAVREKLLLRGDEIQVGNTVLLFNSELNIRNARFSNSSVYLYPADNDTIVGAQWRNEPERLRGADRQSTEFLMQVADWFSAPPAGLADTAARLAGHVKELFHADAVVLMVRDAVSGELRPLVALPDGTNVRVNRTLVATAAERREALLASEHADTLPEVEPAPADNHAVAAPIAGVSTICAPLLEDASVTGVLVVEKNALDYFSLRDLAVLQAVGRLAAGAMQSASLSERLSAGEASAAAPGIIPSRNPAVQALFRDAGKAASSGATVLITGESGTGKEVLARFVHNSSSRAGGPFVALNCGAIPAALFESELFGYERGAFTGAAKTTAGKIEAAHGGTLFLDEIGELEPALQPKLLRFLQDKAFYRVGGTRAMDADVRIIAATNADLGEAVRAGRFREDLWYRLNVLAFEMPPLRGRSEDIGPLAAHMVAESAARVGRKVLGIHDAALSLLARHDWPGNIRELANAVERAVLLAPGQVLMPEDFSWLGESRLRPPPGAGSASVDDAVRPIAEVERECIVRALRHFGGNQARTADALGIHRNTLRNKIAEYRIAMREIPPAG